MQYLNVSRENLGCQCKQNESSWAIVITEFLCVKYLKIDNFKQKTMNQHF